MSPKRAAFTAWLLIFVVIGVGGGSHMIPQLIELHDLADSHSVTTGKIIETYPQVHSICKYRYSVEGKFYEQTGRPCGDYVIGEQVAIYFSPRDPSRSVIADPERLFLNDLIPSLLALFLFPIIGAAVAHWRAYWRAHQMAQK
jgi:Protein of unknown function (DUF3592)